MLETPRGNRKARVRCEEPVLAADLRNCGLAILPKLVEGGEPVVGPLEAAEQVMTGSLCYVTAGSRGEAIAIGRTLVEERLAASANVLDNATSIYWWRGALQQAGEAVLILKTRTDLVERVIARVRELHSYECPCVVALPIAAGNPQYLDWIAAETQPV
jgi:periplasmic divalent cation tolerance protein